LRVKVRKATGRRVDGGSKIGKIEVLVGGAFPSALQTLAVFVGKNCGSGWREEGLAERVLDEVAKAVFPTTTLPPLILPSRVCNIVFRDAPFPSSTITPPPALFHLRKGKERP
jgi:hypothetical protein